ncbi:sulfate ABC transporter substrate-binding protein [Alkalinema sp. FACHB-956]|uniref:sulfate ABC transporter substrate-binding protein n=1 Tax=Alkalinema sp. FACHB-956 TaxID=2692768 RepID=UPI001685964D|nr:sulfate ABC transporter substrate-binding protein [Alkalinema sp. FACHB-956]MBD2329821.1 sulfate ABC transporter substrate-binding protein [Alkalinema sp. FACHB-956]
MALSNPSSKKSGQDCDRACHSQAFNRAFSRLSRRYSQAFYRALQRSRLSQARLIQRGVGLFVVGLVLSGLLGACQGFRPAGNAPIELTLASFSVPKIAYRAIIPKFEDKWQQEHNQRLTINQSYAGSGAQTRAVIDGLEADVVHLALGLDVQKIEKAGLIDPGWEDEAPNQAIVTRSVVALAVRDGNPKQIQTWADLVKPGIQVITADPRSSGVARWNFLALWNAALQANGNDETAKAFVKQVYQQVPVLARDAREATDTFFKQEVGDVLINYENELLLAKLKGESLPFTVPPVNISIDAPVAVVDKNVDRHGNRAAAEAFVQYLFSPEAQVEFAKVGFRPVNPEVAQSPEMVQQYPAIAQLTTAKAMGGWKMLQKTFFDQGGVFDQIQGTASKAS